MSTDRNFPCCGSECENCSGFPPLQVARCLSVHTPLIDLKDEKKHVDKLVRGTTNEFIGG